MINEENEGKFKNIIYYICYKDLLDQSEEIMRELKIKFLEIKEVINKYEKLLNYFNYFFPRKYNNFIQDINKVILDITESNSLNTLQTDYKTYLEKYKKYYKEAKSMDKYMKSIFFIQIYKETKKQYENHNDDSYYLTEANKRFNELKKLFANKGSTSKIDNLVLGICRKAIKDNLDKLRDEIKNIEEIFQIKNFKYLNKIDEEFLLLSQKDLIFNISVAIDNFISAIKGKTTKFLDDIKKIRKSLRGKNKKEIILESKEIFRDYDINIDEEADFQYMKILFELKKNPDYIQFLLNTSLEDCGGLKELTLENDNCFISVNDILDLEKCILFLKDLGPVKEKEDIEVLKILKEKALNKPDIILYFEKFVANFAQIKTLQSSKYKSENLKYQIDAIFKNAIFEIKNENSRYIAFMCN